MKPVLYIISGLPGSGKSTLAKYLVAITKATYLRIDTIEQGIADLCSFNVQGEGYRLSYRIAEDNLKLGNSVIADSCNPWKLTRDEWESVATNNKSEYVNIEVKCSDRNEHRKRAETRLSEIEGLRLPGWDEIEKREYHLWDRDHVEIDTAGKSIKESEKELLNKLTKYIN
jgi:predicted kinase